MLLLVLIEMLLLTYCMCTCSLQVAGADPAGTLGFSLDVTVAPTDNDTPSNTTTVPSNNTLHTQAAIPAPTQTHDENAHDQAPVVGVGAEFPLDRLSKLEEQLSRPKWVVPVRPGDDLEVLLRSAIKLCGDSELRKGSGDSLEGSVCVCVLEASVVNLDGRGVSSQHGSA